MSIIRRHFTWTTLNYLIFACLFVHLIIFSIFSDIVIASSKSIIGDRLATEAAEDLKRGDKEHAIYLWEQALTIYTRDLGYEHPTTRAIEGILDNLDQGKTSEIVPDNSFNSATEEILNRIVRKKYPSLKSIRLLVKNSGCDNGDWRFSYAAHVFEQGSIESAISEWEQAALFYFHELGESHEATLATESILDSLTHDNHLGLVYGRGNRLRINANIAYEDGRAVDALRLAEQARTIITRELNSGNSHPYHITNLFDAVDLLANIYLELGRYKEAMDLSKEYLEEKQKRFGVNYPNSIVNLVTIAQAYNELGNYNEALKRFQEALKKTTGKDDITYSDFIKLKNNVAMSLMYAGKFDDALKLHKEVMELRKNKFGIEHPITLQSMDNTASCYMNIGNYGAAIELSKKTEAYRKSNESINTPDTLRAFQNLALCYRKLGQRSESISMYRQIFSLLDRLNISYKKLARDERSTALARYQDYYSNFASFLSEDSIDFPEAFTITEKGKARSLLEELTARQALNNSGIPTADAKHLKELQSRIEFLDGKLIGGSENISDLRLKRDTLAKERDNLNRILSEKYPRYATLSNVNVITADMGRKLLPEHGLFVSWLFDQKADGVSVILPKDGELTVNKCTPGEEIFRRAEAYRWFLALPDAKAFAKALNEVPLVAWMEKGILFIGPPDKIPNNTIPVVNIKYSKSRSVALVNHGQWLSEALLKPLEKHIRDAKSIIIAPDGILATIPWDTLPWNGKMLGEQKQLTMVQSLSVYSLLKDREREYDQELTASKIKSISLLAVGGAQYEIGRGKDRGGFHRAPKSFGPANNTYAHLKDMKEAYADMKTLSWPSLPGSVKEVEDLHTLIGGTKIIGREASETTLRAMSDKGDLAQYKNIHFATHGYLNTSFPQLSSIVLTKTGNDESNDGFITAGEWPSFNLRSDLMVLSACETGLGKVVSGEGVQGLPYALYVAGNRDTLLSLWKVDDWATSIFMERFWTKMKNGMADTRALAETKSEFIHGEVDKAYTDPYFWAPFILYGIQ